MLTNPLLILGFQPHPTENTWNDKDPAQAKVRHTVRALPGHDINLSREQKREIPGVSGIFPLASQNGEELGSWELRGRGEMPHSPAHCFL